MLSTIIKLSLVGFSCLSTVSAGPIVKFPLSNGFPNVTNPSAALTAIEVAAHGSLSNAPGAMGISADTITSLQLIAFNELSEVAFFTQLLTNITTSAPGFEIEDAASKAFIIKTLTAVQAQEELHELNANGALMKNHATTIQPCEYIFPVNTFAEAVALASTFTDVVLGTLQQVQTLFANSGDAGLIQGVGSVIGQEGEQNGYYRTLLNKIPSALPFLTTSTREFAFSALNQMFVVPGSCPNLNAINLPIFKPLTVLTMNIQPAVQKIRFEAEIGMSKVEDLSLVYINQQNLPITEALEVISTKGSMVTFDAEFPFDSATFGNGLTIAALTNASSTMAFTSAAEVAAVTVAGPGLIEIN